jgi:tetratricopeptide (TPR) repeat protein
MQSLNNPLLIQLNLPLSKSNLAQDLPSLQYVPIWLYLNRYRPIASSNNLVKIDGCLQALEHLLDIGDIGRAEKLLLIELTSDVAYQLMISENNFQLHSQIYSWGYNKEVISKYKKILEFDEIQHRHTWLINIGVCYRNLDEYQAAQEYFEAALTYAQNNHNSSQIVLSYTALISAYGAKGEFDLAIEMGEAGLEFARQNTLSLDKLRPLRSSLAVAYAYRYEMKQSPDDLHLADEHFAFALNAARETNNQFAQALELGRSINWYMLKGDLDQAIDCGLQFVALKLENPMENAVAFGNLGIAYSQRGREKSERGNRSQAEEDIAQGISYMLQSLDIAEEMEEFSNQAWLYCNIAELYFFLERSQEADNYLNLAQAIIENLGDQRLATKLIELQEQFSSEDKIIAFYRLDNG